MTDVNFFGQIRGSIRQLFTQSQADVQPVLDDSGELVVAQGMPERTDLVKFGYSYGAQIPTGSAFTFVNAWPTTRAELVLYNGESALPTGKTYVIDRCWLAVVGAVVNLGSFSMLGQLSPVARAIAAAADNTAVLRQQLSGRLAGGASVNSNAKLAVANTAFAVANQWAALGPVGFASNTLTNNIGNCIEANVYGRYLVPPGGAFCLAGLGATAGGTAIVGVEWHEVTLNLG